MKAIRRGPEARTRSTSRREEAVHAEGLLREVTYKCNTITGAATSCTHIPLRDSLLVQCQQTRMNTGRQSDAHKHFHISVEELKSTTEIAAS
jgi:hypothetical protein